MPQVTEQSARAEFFSLGPTQLDELIGSWGWPAFRAGQMREGIYGQLVNDFDRLTVLSKADRRWLSDRLALRTGELARVQSSADGTLKLLLKWPSGASAETVMIPDADRRTACVSSQVGCPVGCRFCASGINGVKGNLTAGQIVEQVMALNGMLNGSVKGSGDLASAPGVRSSGRKERERVSHVVFMGMGEPLANYGNVMGAVRILHDPKCLNLSARRITISTVGVPAKMRELAHEELPVNLALSLHAPSEELRKQLIPWAEHFALGDILDAARYYFERSGREITLEYILLSGVNDRVHHARELARLCRTLRANVNLIRYNEVEGLSYQRPLSKDVVAFQEVLREAGVNAHVRKSRGRDIDAACGQLRRKELAAEGPASGAQGSGGTR